MFGITPAHAGRIGGSSRMPNWLQDHPRACGKNPYTHASPNTSAGSPPRMREEYTQTGKHSLLRGITPAHAGRIYKPVHSYSRNRDHPRACGKNVKKRMPAHKIRGSPPRMREEFKYVKKLSVCTRITPAHAGRIVKTP